MKCGERLCVGLKRTGFGLSPPQPQPHQIVVAPADVPDHALQRANWKCVAETMVRDDDPPAIWMDIDVVAAA